MISTDYVAGRIASITMGKGQRYRFEYLFGPKGAVVETLVVDTAGKNTVFRF